MIFLKSKEQIGVMNEANMLVHDCLNLAEQLIEPNLPTIEIDIAIKKFLVSHNIKSSFKNYKGYPANCCVSINEEVVHGIPSSDKIIKAGDLVSIDMGIVYKGFMGDAAKTFFVGEVSKEARQLSDKTREALWAGIEKMTTQNRLHDIGKVISLIAKDNGYGNLLNFCGHGIGKRQHSNPSVFNYVEKREPNIRLQNGLVLALEPMFTLGSNKGIIGKDSWTVSTLDKSLSAHWELSIAIWEDKPVILGINNDTI